VQLAADRHMKTRQQKIFAILAALVVVIALSIYFFNWNMLRGFVERRVTTATGRSFHIQGDLDVKLSFKPRIIVNDVSMGNATWSETPVMATLSRGEVVVDLRSLFHRDIAVPLVHLIKPQLLLEKNKEGVANWNFANGKDNKAEDGKTVRIGDLQIDEGQVTYRSVPERADLQVLLASVDTHGADRFLKVEARGNYLDLDTEAHGEVGAISNIADLERAFPLKLSGHAGKTHLAADGTIDRLAHLDGLHLKFALSGGSLADLYPLLGVPLPATPAYSLAGHLDQTGKRWDLQQLDGHVGNSDIHGNFSVDRGPLPQYMSAVLNSENLDLKDLSGFIGARTESGKTIVHADRVLPDTPFSFDKLHAANADIQLKGKHIQTERMPIDDMNMHLKLNDAHLLLDPLNFGVAGGNITATINLDANESPIKTDADIKLQKIRFDSLFPDFKLQKASAGIIGGRAKFVGEGDSIAKMLGSANGQIAFMMNGGSVSQLAVRLANLDVANSIILLLGGDKKVQIRCMVVDLDAKDGNMEVKSMVLDTAKSVINGRGSINFKDETLDLRLASDSKSISLAALRGPIDVTGTFKKPNAGPSVKNVSGRVAAAAALGAVSLPLAFIPLIDFGGGEDSDCATLLKDATDHSKEQPHK
jgi:uncharacterized protein involved in outer membrane biogenesis